jgi:hypothetical protein
MTQADQLRQYFQQAVKAGTATQLPGLDITPPMEKGVEMTALRNPESPDSFYVMQRATTEEPQETTFFSVNAGFPEAVPEFVLPGQPPITLGQETLAAFQAAERSGKVFELGESQGIDITPPRERGVKVLAFPTDNALFVVSTTTTRNPNQSTVYRVDGQPPVALPR